MKIMNTRNFTGFGALAILATVERRVRPGSLRRLSEQESKRCHKLTHAPHLSRPEFCLSSLMGVPASAQQLQDLQRQLQDLIKQQQESDKRLQAEKQTLEQKLQQLEAKQQQLEKDQATAKQQPVSPPASTVSTGDFPGSFKDSGNEHIAQDRRLRQTRHHL